MHALLVPFQVLRQEMVATVTGHKKRKGEFQLKSKKSFFSTHTFVLVEGQCRPGPPSLVQLPGDPDVLPLRVRTLVQRRREGLAQAGPEVVQAENGVTAQRSGG